MSRRNITLPLNLAGLAFLIWTGTRSPETGMRFYAILAMSIIVISNFFFTPSEKRK